MSEETKKKISESRIGEKNPNYGKKFTDEQKAIVSKRFKGKKQSKEHIEKRKMYGEKNPQYGKHITEEVKQKIRDALSGANSYAAKHCVLFNQDDEIEFVTLTAAYNYVTSIINKGTRYCRKHKYSGIDIKGKINYILTDYEINLIYQWAKENNQMINSLLDRCNLCKLLYNENNDFFKQEYRKRE